MKKFPVEMKKSPFFEGIEDTEEEKEQVRFHDNSDRE